ncbi:MAG: hypothetical protein PHE92_09605 [Candidatus Cloacimonetes bacterium]|nr:hypothetical protein [Candidatus Cloacimonadota bacterium]
MTNHNIRIETGTPDGDRFGFTEELFSGWLEYDPKNNIIYLHYIISRKKNEGNVTVLIRKWLNEGYDVRVVMPRSIMQHILKKLRFEKSFEMFPDQYAEEVEVWKSTERSYVEVSTFTI